MPNDKKAYAQREKAYMQGKLFPQIKVGMTKVNLTPTVVKDERGIPHTEPNTPVYIYDTSGPYSDPNYQVDLKKGLPRMREQWIIDRNDTEQLKEVTSEYGKQRLADHSLDHLRFEHIQLPRRAQAGKHITQMAYAKAGIITPEMEYVAIRENRYVDAAFKGMRPAVIALIAAPILNLARGMVWWKIALAAIAAVIVWQLGVSPVWFIIAGAAAGILHALHDKRGTAGNGKEGMQ